MSKPKRTYKTTIHGQEVTVKVYKSSAKGQLVIEDAGELDREYDSSADTERDLYDIITDDETLWSEIDAESET